MDYVTYKAFGAVGDGKNDDFAAIVSTHAYANEHHLPVKADRDAKYYIGGGPDTAVIRTDTDWGTAEFIIDDRNVEKRNADIFHIPASGEVGTLPLQTLKKGQTALDLQALGITLDRDYLVTVENDARRQYIRFGLNQDAGSAQQDTFILKKDGSILSGINWDYDRISAVKTRIIDEAPLTLQGGVFTTIANQAESKYTYYSRGISVTRSNVTLENIKHYVTGELDHGAPYGGFFSFSFCANCMLKNCFVTGHKIDSTIGSAGKPVDMGSYDIGSGSVVGLTLYGCKQEDICNTSLWGVFGSNFCKQVTFDHCVLSRTDAHCGLRDYTIRDSVLGWMGTNTIGFGTLLMDNVTSFCDHLIGFRDDYGCTWDGDLILRNVTWIPAPGHTLTPTMFTAHNGGTHDFGYPCTLPHHITIENVTVVDTNTPAGYKGLRIFSDFNPAVNAENPHPTAFPFPLGVPESIEIHGLRAVSGKEPILCDNGYLFAETKVIR